VNKPVDNYGEMRITTRVLWIMCGYLKSPKLLTADPCAALAEAVKMQSPLETGTSWGRPRSVGGIGRPVPCTGTWHRRAARGASQARQQAGLAQRGRARPLHLIHGGALSDFTRQERLCSDRHDMRAACPAGRRCASCPGLGTISSRPRGQLARPERRAYRKRRYGNPLLPANLARGLYAGFLCTSMWITCAKRDHACAHVGEMLGISSPGCCHNSVITWESPIHNLCRKRKQELSTCRAAISNK